MTTQEEIKDTELRERIQEQTEGKIIPCNHQDQNGNYTYEKEDDRCTTDRGTIGGIWYRCTQCDEDITEEIE